MATEAVVVLAAVRTAVGDFGGGLKEVPPGDLAARVVGEAVRRAKVEPEAIAHCVFGQVIHTEPADMYLARVAALRGGLPEAVPALTVNRLCGSGLQAVVSAAQQIQLGLCDFAVAGGAESMSRAGYLVPGARFGLRMGDGVLVDMMTRALHCPFSGVHMGVTAENVARRYGISRADQDALALESHRRATRAWAEGRFADQIVPVEVPTRKGVVLFERDEHFRPDATLEDLARLPPVFQEGGTVTAGNASGINDGAAALVLASERAAARQGLAPLAHLVAYTHAGVDPAYMGIGPVPAVRELLARTGLAVDDIDLWEVNEAFAAQALAVARELKLPPERVNPNGSGISLGHPVGATGAILAVKAIHELIRTGGRRAVVALCIGGGQGIAALLERP
ncbi:MAG: 3-ketoacyl-CoA thiolase [Porticoccaceae bacterium]|nr:MAG: 3-ketoacyl-CoA thiolase [Porticoccaceae bacterium]